MELAKKLYENVMGTTAQNEKAKKEMAEQDAKNPDTTQAKVNRMLGKKPNNEELLAPMQAAFDKYEKKKADAKEKSKQEKEASRKSSMTMDEMNMKKGGKVRGCGIARKGLTKGRMV